MVDAPHGRRVDDKRRGQLKASKPDFNAGWGSAQTGKAVATLSANGVPKPHGTSFSGQQAARRVAPKA